MFYHRKNELETIKSFFSARKKALLVYGKRRVGKTTLIKEALKDYEGTVLFFQCTSESYESNTLQLTRELGLLLNDEWRHFDTFHDIFRFIVSLDRPFVVVLDEYNELKDSYGGIQTDSMMQKIVDSLAQSQVRIIISGSAVAVMEELLDNSNPLFDRFHEKIRLTEFDYLESAAFMEGWSYRQCIACHAVFGGNPAALELLDLSRSVEWNMEKLLVSTSGGARSLIENTLLKEFGKIGPVLSILSRIGNGKRTYSELRDVFDQKNTGNLARWLGKLESNDIVRKTSPLNGKENGKNGYYTICDNLFRFYFSYVYPNRSRIESVGAHSVFEGLVKPTFDTYISYRFEDTARQYFSRLAKAGRLPGIIGIGSYWYDDRKRHMNGEFDVVLEYTDGYDVVEVKYWKAPMELESANEEADKIRDIRAFKARRIGFVSIEGFNFTSDEYFLVDGKMLFEDMQS